MTGDLQQMRVRLLVSGDLSAIKDVIDGTGRFPSGMLDDMTSAFLAGSTDQEFWLSICIRETTA